MMLRLMENLIVSHLFGKKRWIYFWDMMFLWCKYSTWPNLTAYQMFEYLAINPYQASARKLHSGGGIK